MPKWEKNKVFFIIWTSVLVFFFFRVLSGKTVFNLILKSIFVASHLALGVFICMCLNNLRVYVCVYVFFYICHAFEIITITFWMEAFVFLSNLSSLLYSLRFHTWLEFALDCRLNCQKNKLGNVLGLRIPTHTKILRLNSKDCFVGVIFCLFYLTLTHHLVCTLFVQCRLFRLTFFRKKENIYSNCSSEFSVDLLFSLVNFFLFSISFFHGISIHFSIFLSPSFFCCCCFLLYEMYTFTFFFLYPHEKNVWILNGDIIKFYYCAFFVYPSHSEIMTYSFLHINMN